MENVNYKQLWHDLKNIYIDQITVEGEDIVFVSDLKTVMDELEIDYNMRQ